MIEQVIFRTLAAGQGINLPGIGSLNHTREPATITDDEIIPPRRSIDFSRQENPNYISIIELVASDQNTNIETARMMYEKWLDSATAVPENDILEIKDVGVVKDGTFYISETLYDEINPLPKNHSNASGKSERRRKGFPWLKAVILLLVLLVAAAIIYFVIVLLNKNAEINEQRRIASIEKVVETTNESLSDDTAEAEVQSAADANAAQQDVEIVTATTATTAGETMYYLVVGVFAIDSNADKLIKSDPLLLGQAKEYEKHPFKDGKTMVTAYKSTDRNAVERRRRELQWIDSEIWVYGAVR